MCGWNQVRLIFISLLFLGLSLPGTIFADILSDLTRARDSIPLVEDQLARAGAIPPLEFFSCFKVLQRALSPQARLNRALAERLSVTHSSLDGLILMATNPDAALRNGGVAPYLYDRLASLAPISGLAVPPHDSKIFFQREPFSTLALAWGKADWTTEISPYDDFVNEMEATVLRGVVSFLYISLRDLGFPPLEGEAIDFEIAKARVALEAGALELGPERRPSVWILPNR